MRKNILTKPAGNVRKGDFHPNRGRCVFVCLKKTWTITLTKNEVKLCLHYCFGINMLKSNTHHKLHKLLIILCCPILCLNKPTVEFYFLCFMLYLQVNILIIIINSYLICIFWFIIQLFCGSTTVLLLFMPRLLY